ncbi:MAG: hypothetical protein NTZ18_04370 [Candidatus Komeilibacteria bacterium]|nr:hypothetical protein [Candidatus Komeilibacteria bacterium]
MEKVSQAKADMAKILRGNTLNGAELEGYRRFGGTFMIELWEEKCRKAVAYPIINGRMTEIEAEINLS